MATGSIGHVAHRHGAYLVSLNTNACQATEDAVPDELFDCAGSLARAKRVLVEMARGTGFSGAPRWTQDGTGWWLAMTGPDPDLELDDDEFVESTFGGAVRV